MSAISKPNTNTPNTSRYQKKVTDYSKFIFQGVQYKNQDEAVLAGAKTYAKMDWETIKMLNEQLKIGITPSQLIEAKKEIIIASIAKRNETPEEFGV